MPAAYMRVRDAVGRVVYKLNQGYDIVGKMAAKVVAIADKIDEIEINDGTVAAMKALALWAGIFWLATSATVKTVVWDRFIMAHDGL